MVGGFLGELICDLGMCVSINGPSFGKHSMSEEDDGG